jgi:hypothetical protein
VTSDDHWKLYARALSILDGRANGHALPIIRKLVARRFPPAATVLSDYLPDAQSVALLRKTARQGDAGSAYNLAITHLNRRDMRLYRSSLAHAARLSEDAARELRAFKVRFPHDAMRRFKRIRPDRD